jgi:glycosyltransferase involved in cell wall biosynthesis
MEPKVVIMTPMKNVSKHLDRYFELLMNINYPRSQLSLAILEGDSVDDSKKILYHYKKKLASNFISVKLFHHDHGISIPEPRHLPTYQRIRRSLIAAARNRLITGALGDSDWVLWLDADLEFYSSNLIYDLLSAQKRIVVPACFLPNKRIFDFNTFVFKLPNKFILNLKRVLNYHSQFQESRAYLIDGIFQPPMGHGRYYLDKFKNDRLVRVDSVGGTALLIDSNLHREGLVFPTFSYKGYIETEGLARMAYDMGTDCWALPQIGIIHSDT